MKRYSFKARDANGKSISGEVEAASINQAVKLIRQKNLVLISIKLKKGVGMDIFKGFSEKVSSADLTNFTRQFSTMINAGLPLTESLSILRTQSKNVGMQKTISKVLADVEEGQSLSSAMGKHPKVFSKTYVALLKSGEMGGVMDDVLSRLAENLEKQEEFRGKVKGALIYPAIVVVGMILVSFVMMVFVVPKMTSLYDQFGAELPITTKILMAVSDNMARFWPLLLGFFALSAWGFKAYRNTKEGRRKTDALYFKIPIVGELQKQIILTDVTRTLGMMVGAGVSILKGLKITADVVSNVIIADALKDAAQMVEKGFPIAFAFSKHPDAFPFIVSQMIAVGEETGKMDEVLEKVSHVFEIESDQKVKALTSAVEPIILMFLGVGVAFLVISILLPIYNLTNELAI